MRPEELMLGDIIKTPKGIRKIEELSNKNYLLDWEDYGCTVEEVEPVSITQEILEKNGFVKRSDRDDKLGKMEYYQLEDYGFVYHYSNGEWEFSLQNTQDHRLFSGYLNYVHELQHALRLCKIDKEITL